MNKKTTKELLADSFLELAQTLPINKITIAKITSNCEVTQPTFYRYFRDKHEMIGWIYANEAGKNIDKVGTDGYVWKDTFLDGMRFYNENRQFMVNALKHTSGRDSFLLQMSEMNIRFIENEIKKRLDVSKCPNDLSAIVKMFCYGTNQFLYDWLIEKSDLSYEQVADLMERSIPEVLRPYLCE